MFLTKAFVVATALVGLGVAAPTRLDSRDVSAESLQQLGLFAEYSAAAYCTSNVDSPGNKVTCAAGNCPNVEKAETVTLTEFVRDDEYGDVAGFLAADTTNKLIVLAFRGSRTIDNWIANLDFGLQDVNQLCSSCRAHGGFWKSWQSVEEDLTVQIKSALEKYPDHKLVFTGHSFGAAVATFAAAALRKSNYKIELYSYGSPRIGNAKLAQFITDQGSNYRITHTDDIVPRLPPRLFGFQHISPEYWITSDNEATVGAGDIEVITGVGATGGNTGQDGKSVSAHSWYFVEIYKCK